jgi:hyperosmotically inducible protein
MKASDRNLESRIREALRGKMGLSQLDINVRVRDGEAVLTGIVDVLSERVYAETLISRIPGVRSVENNLTISTDGTITNADIKKEIMSVLREDKSPQLDNVDVEVSGGVAELSGGIKTLDLSQDALNTARKTRGVRGVVNNLKTRGEPVDDAIVTSDVNSALADSGISAPDIDVITKKGKVTLNGWVNNNSEIEAATEITSQVPGVVKINNRLKARNKRLL